MAVSNKKQKKQKGIEEGINTENKKNKQKRIYKGEFRDHTRIQCKAESLTQQMWLRNYE